MSEFISKQIGVQDTERHEKIKALYEELTDRATFFIVNTQSLFKDEDLKHEIVLEILKLNKEELTLYLKRGFVKGNNISIPGINMEKLISTDLIELPIEYETVFSLWAEINSILNKIKETGFYFPLRKLWDVEYAFFVMNEEFSNELLNSTASFTSTEKQNEILEVVERFVSVLNDMIELRIIKSQGMMWMNATEIMSGAIDQDKFAARPLIPARKMFNRGYPFERFGNNPNFVGGNKQNISDVVR